MSDHFDFTQELLAGIGPRVQSESRDPVVYITCGCGCPSHIKWRCWTNNTGVFSTDVTLTHESTNTTTLVCFKNNYAEIPAVNLATQLCARMKVALRAEGFNDCGDWWHRLSLTVARI